MKIIFMLFALIVIEDDVYAGMMCGMPPLPPMGCNYDQKICICSGSGMCEWMYTDCM